MDKTDLKKMRDFEIKLQKLADEEFGFSDYGDRMVEVNMNDRSRNYPMYWIPVPYDDEAATLASLDMIMECHLRNLAMATDAINRYMERRRWEIQRIRTTQEKK